MNWTERIGIEGAETMIAFLSKEFKVKKPKIRNGYKGNSGLYQPKTKTIRLGRDCKPWAVAHEFAHYLFHLAHIPPKPKQILGDYSYYGRYDNWYRANRGVSPALREWHSQGFYSTLRRVIAVAGDAEQYPWSMEYKQLHRWAKRDGIFLLTQPTPMPIIKVSEISDGDKT